MHKKILRLAVPNILSNISVPLLGIVDIALVGRLSEDHIGAVGLGGIIFSFLYWNFGFLRIGTTGITAQAYGAGDENLMRLTLWRSLILGTGVAIILILSQTPLLQLGHILLNTPEDTLELVKNYFYIRIWDAPAALALFSLNGWFFGKQNTWIPMIITIGVNVCNMILSAYFVRVLHWDISGVAWGTVLSQYMGVSLYFIILAIWQGKKIFIYALEALKFNQELFRFLRINRDFFFRSMSLSLAFGFFYRQSASLSAQLLAVNTILLQYVNFMSYGVDGFAHAAESLTGKYFGAQNLGKLKTVVRYSLYWGGGLSAIYAGVYFWGGSYLLGIFTDDNLLMKAAKPYLAWMIPIPFVGFVCYLWDGVFGGLTASTYMRNTMLLSLFLFVASYYILYPSLGNHGLWMAFTLFLGSRGLTLSYVYFRRFGW